MKLSYAGGIIGRIPDGLTVSNASYIGKLTASGSYLGQIAEVNDGIITECTVKEFNSEDSKNTYTGGLTGLNSINGIVKADNKFANGISLRGSAVLGAYMGRNLADIELVSAAAEKPWGAWTGITGAGINSLSIDRTADNNVVSGSAIGLLTGENAGTINIQGSSVSCSVINDADFAGLYAGINTGTINDRGTKTVFDDLEENGGQGRYAGSLSGNVINAKLSVNNVNKTGLVTGKNIGEVNNIITSNDTGISSIASNGSYVGGFIGQNGDGAREGKVEKCINYMEVKATATNSRAGGIVALSDGVSQIELCDNRALVSADLSAAGILGWSGEGVTSNNTNDIRDCINIGEITATTNTTAGIAGKVNYGVVDICRNYGSASYGISASADDSVIFSDNLEASGNDEGVPSSDVEDAQLTKNPIAPVNDRNTLVRNFYIFGVCTEKPLNPGEGYRKLVKAEPNSENHKYTDIDYTVNTRNNNNLNYNYYSNIGITTYMKNHYLRGDLNAPTWPFNGITPENSSKIRELYKNITGNYYSSGNLDERFVNYLLEVYYLVYNIQGWDAALSTAYDTLIELADFIYTNGYIKEDYGSTYYKDGTEASIGGTDVYDVYDDTTSHWPKQLYYYTDENEVCTLVYHRWNNYYPTSITGLSSNISGVDSVTKFEEIDSKFVTMVNNTDAYPNYDEYGDDNTLIVQGFLPEQP